MSPPIGKKDGRKLARQVNPRPLGSALVPLIVTWKSASEEGCKRWPKLDMPNENRF
jgi:hypothetical protein